MRATRWRTLVLVFEGMGNDVMAERNIQDVKETKGHIMG